MQLVLISIVPISTREKVEGVVYEGNDRFEGYSIDLIDGISKISGFKYVFELVPDKGYGSYNKETKKWDGLVKHLLERVRVLTNIALNTIPNDLIPCYFRKRIWQFVI